MTTPRDEWPPDFEAMAEASEALCSDHPEPYALVRELRATYIAGLRRAEAIANEMAEAWPGCERGQAAVTLADLIRADIAALGEKS